MATYVPFTDMETFHLIEPNAWREVLLNNVNFAGSVDEAVVQVVSNAMNDISTRTIDWVKRVNHQVELRYNGGLENLAREITTLTHLVHNQQALLTEYKTQLDARPAIDSARRPKIGEPPVF